jgi:hypothetical protein
MGKVYEGRDTRLERIVATKVLPPHLGQRAAVPRTLQSRSEDIAEAQRKIRVRIIANKKGQP